MYLSDRGAKLIASFEGFSTRPYRDAVGVWTIGYGHTRGVYGNTRPISRTVALELLRSDARVAANAVRNGVKVKLNQCEFDALVSLTYNIGIGGFAESTVLRELNQGHRFRAGLAFLLWDKGGGRTLLGLSRRRRRERRLFRSKRKRCGTRRRV